MNLRVGIVGLPNVGKSTLFNALLKKSSYAKTSEGQAGHAKTANYPFTTIEPNVGVVEVPDKRLEELADVIARDSSSSTQNDRKGWVNEKPPIVPAVVQFVDIAGLVKGAHKGEGLGNQFLAHIREVNAIVFVVRDFKNPDIIQTGTDPLVDLDVLKTELLLKDLESVERVLGSRAGGLEKEKEILEKAKRLIEQGKWLGEEMASDELVKISDLQLLSTKKIIVVVNCDESATTENTDENTEDTEVIKGSLRICAKMEEELSSLSADEQKEYLEQVGVSAPGLNKLIRKAYEVLGLMSFYTAGVKEVRAWTVRRGVLASVAAGVIHTDFERGFIAADIVDFSKFVQAGGWKEARDLGFVKTIGKGEVMPHDVVVEFKFNM